MGDRLVAGLSVLTMSIAVCAACSSSTHSVTHPTTTVATVSPNSTQTTTAAHALHRVIIKNMAFDPAMIQIKAGDTVVWLFEDGTVKHQVVGPGFASPKESSGAYSVTFSSPGTFRYHDGLHSQVSGVVVVTR